MTKKLFILAILLFVSIPAFAQSVDTAWVRRYNGPGNGYDIASAIGVDDSGNVYVTGTSDGYGTDKDYATIKYDPSGNELWVKRYDGPGNDYDEALALAVDDSGNVYVTGQSSGEGNHPDYFDYATIKYYSNGDTAWVRRYNGPGNDWDIAYAIGVDDSGNVYVTGQSEGSETNKDYATIKYYSNGDTAWVRRYNGPGNDWDIASAIGVDGSGNVYVTGFSVGSGTRYDYATIKYYSNGDTAWVRRYNGPANGWDTASDIAIDSSGNVYITGRSTGSGTDHDYATIKYYPNGDTAWVRRYNGPGNGYDTAIALAVDGSGNVYVTGFSAGSGTAQDYATIKYYPNGDTAWVRRYNGPGNGHDGANTLAVDGSDNVYVTGVSDDTAGYYDCATIKYYPNGDTAWVRRYNGPGNGWDIAYAIGVDDSGNVYVTGSSEGDYVTIKYVRGKGCGDLLFRPNPDGWNFGNTQENMWPESWWQQFDYYQYPYPSDWCTTCTSSDFPDWPLWVLAFGEDQCYWDPPPGEVVYKENAVQKWFAKKYQWRGSCFGFAISSFLFFDEYLDVSTEFPPNTEVYSVPINDDSRLMVNKYMLYQFGQVQQEHIRNNIGGVLYPGGTWTTPNQALQACKNMFNASTRDDKVLCMISWGGHAVNPYRCEVDMLNPEITHIYVYDNIFPDIYTLRVSIDTTTNTWFYNGLGWGGWWGLFLMDPISNYTTNPIMSTYSQFPDELKDDKTGDFSEYFELYFSETDTALFESPAGSIGYMGDSFITSDADGIPIIPITGQETPPIGYYLPNDAWTLQFSGISDSTFRLSLFKNSTVLVYRRFGVDYTQTENLSYSLDDTALLVLNPDTENRFYNIHGISIAPDSEICYKVTDIPIYSGDSIGYSIKSGSQLQLDNYGGTNTYDLNVHIVGIGCDTVFLNEGITLPSNTSHRIIPDWRANNDTLIILVDSGMSGDFSDTIFTESELCICGDVNNDSTIDLSDVIYIANYLLKGGDPPPDPLCRANANGDTVINLGDVIYLANYKLKGGPAPHDCGNYGQ